MTTIAKSFCKKQAQSESISDYGRYTIALYDTIEDIEEEWALVSAAHDIFFSNDFLRCIERCPATGIKPYYAIVKEKNTPVGIIYFQSKYVKLKENLRKPGIEPKTMMQKLTDPIRHAVVSAINFETIVCGNLLLTGDYGFYFKDHIDRNEQFYIVIKAAHKLQLVLKNQDKEPGLILIKDFYADQTPIEGEYHQGFTKFSVQPKMILTLNPAWKTMDDYMESLKSKYRVRARKALEKSKHITKKVFEIDDIAQHRDTIHALYKNVSDQADFNAFVLHPQYFENLKHAFGHNMTFTTYWKDEVMIAFFTSIKNYDVLDAHFLGYDPNLNAEYQLYLNMLYDLTEEGIRKRVRSVDMSRTAVEIKSTVGAVPHEMYLYLRHTNHVINKTVDSILSFVKPEADFVIRSPFRENEDIAK
jgi:predicted N-acyltransferase